MLIEESLGRWMVLDETFHDPEDQHVAVLALTAFNRRLDKLLHLRCHVTQELVDCRNLADRVLDEAFVGRGTL